MGETTADAYVLCPAKFPDLAHPLPLDFKLERSPANRDSLEAPHHSLKESLFSISGIRTVLSICVCIRDARKATKFSDRALFDNMTIYTGYSPRVGSLMTSTITIREIDSILEMKALEKLQKEVWGWDDLDTMPLMNFIVTKEVGGILIGAFDQEKPIGFVFGFVGYDEGEIVFHSHMLAVLPEFREHGIGYRLKLAQRRQAMAKGFKCITWTFDPLQSPNAYLNFSKLGVIASKYKVNFYGEQTSSSLHRFIGTDRLWVSWFLESNRVKQRLECGSTAEPCKDDLANLMSLVKKGADGWPQSPSVAVLTEERLMIEVPPDISRLQEQNPQLAVAWRNATRAAFTEALGAGYIVEDFYRLNRDGELAGHYLLRSKIPNGVNHDSK